MPLDANQRTRFGQWLLTNAIQCGTCRQPLQGDPVFVDDTTSSGGMATSNFPMASSSSSQTSSRIEVACKHCGAITVVDGTISGIA
jgi:hypothetical protein